MKNYYVLYCLVVFACDRQFIDELLATKVSFHILDIIRKKWAIWNVQPAVHLQFTSYNLWISSILKQWAPIQNYSQCNEWYLYEVSSILFKWMFRLLLFSITIENFLFCMLFGVVLHSLNPSKSSCIWCGISNR